jgi:hypothetical protein
MGAFIPITRAETGRRFTALALRTAWRAALLCGKEPAPRKILGCGLGDELAYDLRRDGWVDRPSVWVGEPPLHHRA